MADDEPERPPLDFGPGPEGEATEVAVLTVNQLVAYNLMRARRQKAWTQQETADRLTERTTRKWTAATLSAAERSWQTGRSRQFDANELAAFAAVFECPIAFFFLPINPGTGQDIWYALAKIDEALPFPVLKTRELLDSAVPLRYPSGLVDEVNGLRRLEGLSWSPHASVDWFRPEEHWSPDPPSEEAASDEDPWEAYQERETRAGIERSEADRQRIRRGQTPSKEFLIGVVMSRLQDSLYTQAKQLVEHLEEVLPPRSDDEGGSVPDGVRTREYYEEAFGSTPPEDQEGT